MKITHYKLTAIFLLFSLISFGNGPKGKYEKTKTVEKTFSVNKDAVLNIDNRYGNVDITTWQKNSIEIVVKITVSGNKESKVIDKLNSISIALDGNVNTVSAKTKLSNKSSSWNWLGWGNSVLSYKINYTVKMPISNALNISNDYGSILLNELNGNASINCDYGKLVIGSLNGSDNNININYTNHSNIEYIENAQINADYSGITIEKANTINLDADYANCKFEEINHLNFDCSYGNLVANYAKIVNGDGDYFTMKFGTIEQKLAVDSEYGSIKINRLKPNFDSVNIEAEYTGIRIGVDKRASCTIKTSIDYGNFKYDDASFTFNKSKESNTSKYYEGYHGNAKSDATISISSEYGNVKFYEN